MKKTLLIVLTGTLLFFGSTLGVSAAPLCLNQYVDKNGDGICDYTDSERTCQFIDENEDGICDHAKLRQKKGCNNRRKNYNKKSCGKMNNRNSLRGNGCRR